MGILGPGTREQYESGAPNGLQQWLMGGGAARGMKAGPASGAQQTQYAQGMLDRPAPMMDATQSNQARGQQQTLADMLFRTAQGTAPGAGEMAVNRQIGQAEASQTSQAQAARGANAALATPPRSASTVRDRPRRRKSSTKRTHKASSVNFSAACAPETSTSLVRTRTRRCSSSKFS